MAQFTGFQCDNCMQVYTSNLRTRVKLSFTGFREIGEFFKDLCPNCVTEPEGYTPVKKRKKRGSAASE